MTAIIDLSDALVLATNGSTLLIDVQKDSRAGNTAPTMVANNICSMWRVNGSPGGASAAPGAVAAPDRTTQGGLKLAAPAGGKQRWLISAGICVTSLGGALVLYDRLLHISGLSGTVTTPQTVGGALTRYTGVDSIANQIFVEIYTQVGNTPTTITASYTDQDGNAATTQAVAFGGAGAQEAHSMIQLPLADGDTGVRAVASVTVLASTGTAGDFGVTVVRPLAMLAAPIGGVNANTGGNGALRNFATEPPGPIEVLGEACLAMYMQSGGTALPEFEALLAFMDK